MVAGLKSGQSVNAPFIATLSHAASVRTILSLAKLTINNRTWARVRLPPIVMRRTPRSCQVTVLLAEDRL
jgi:hypothetical protein